MITRTGRPGSTSIETGQSSQQEEWGAQANSTSIDAILTNLVSVQPLYQRKFHFAHRLIRNASSAQFDAAAPSATLSRLPLTDF